MGRCAISRGGFSHREEKGSWRGVAISVGMICARSCNDAIDKKTAETPVAT